jgi:F-type H+-transporting ATPase subunit epsilon
VPVKFDTQPKSSHAVNYGINIRAEPYSHYKTRLFQNVISLPESTSMAFAWRNVFTYNRYAGIAARAVRRALKEDKRLDAERRNQLSVRVSRWKDGVQGEQKRLGTEVEHAH